MKCESCEHLAYGTVYETLKNGMVIPRQVIYCQLDQTTKKRVRKCENFKIRTNIFCVTRYP